MRILFICHPYPNYVPDLLLHGLRKIIGDDVVDFPRKDILYDGILGQSYLDPIPGLMADDSRVDRQDLDAKLASKYFDFVLCDIRSFVEYFPRLRRHPVPLVLVDGEDSPQRISVAGPYIILRRETDGCDSSIPLPMAMPTEVMDWIDQYRDQPKTHSVGFLGSISDPARAKMLGELVRLFPDARLQCWEKDAQWQGRDNYYRTLQGCRTVLTLPGPVTILFATGSMRPVMPPMLLSACPFLFPTIFAMAQKSPDLLRFENWPMVSNASSIGKGSGKPLPPGRGLG